MRCRQKIRICDVFNSHFREKGFDKYLKSQKRLYNLGQIRKIHCGVRNTTLFSKTCLIR